MEAVISLQQSRRFLPVLFLAAAALFLSSCVSIRTAPAPTAERAPKAGVPPSARRTVPQPIMSRGFKTHTVAPGETLWRISKVYDVPLASITRVNRINSDQELRMGQKLNIPQAKDPQQIISLFPSDKWKYIIIHHSATEEGSSLQFHEYHQQKGWDSVGYDFVIDSGKSDKADGFIEITPRWLKQLDGAHCKASDMNVKGIGICLVGNFNEHKVTRAQMDSLVHLVNTLRRYYRIPERNILGHQQVDGSNTDCPGKNFPWDNFKKRLKER